MKNSSMAVLSMQSIVFLFPLVLLYILCTKTQRNKNTSKRKPEPPQPSGALPMIGHLHLLRSKQPLPVLLGDISDHLGPIFTLRLGIRRMAIVSNSELAKECFTTNDRVLASRPKSTQAQILAYNYAMFFLAPYGAYWRTARKASTLALLTKARVETFTRTREEEADAFVRGLHEFWSSNGGKEGEEAKVGMKEWLGDLAYNMVARMVVGKRCSGEAAGFRMAVEELFRLMGVFVPTDLLPWLKMVDFGGHKKEMKEAAKEMDVVMNGLMEMHKKRRSAGGKEEVEDGEKDFMDLMLGMVEANGELSQFDTDADMLVKATALSLLIAGGRTTTTFLTWTVALLVNHQDMLKKAQDELDAHVGRDRLVTESDVENLVYQQAAAKEAFRLCPASPQIVPHEAIEDCTIAGFHIPEGTSVVVNVWKLQRDPKVWPEPLEFRPERFLTSHANVDVRGRHFELLPFRSGRRGCPGVSLSLMMLHFALARLLHSFHLRTPENKPVHMNAAVGVLHDEKLELLIAPRLADEHYY